MNFIFFKRFNFLLISNCIYFNNSKYKINENINISNCLISTKSIGNGGSIDINGGYNLYITESFFFECFSTGWGGAIYFLNGFNAIILKVCSLLCNCADGNNGKFSWITTSINFNNIIEYLSISKCFNNSKGFASIYLQNGYQNIKNVNSSNNMCKFFSGFFYHNPNNLNSQFCTFKNNSSNDSTCLIFWGNSGIFQKSNIINNKSPNFGIVNVYEGNYQIFDCIFIENDISLFLTQLSSILTINNCTIFQPYLKNGNIFLNDIKTIYTNTFNNFYYSLRIIYSNNLYICNQNQIKYLTKYYLFDWIFNYGFFFFLIL